MQSKTQCQGFFLCKLYDNKKERQTQSESGFTGLEDGQDKGKGNPQMTQMTQMKKQKAITDEKAKAKPLDRG